VRRTLEIHKSIKKIGIKVCLEVDDERDGHTTVRDSSTLGTLLVMLEDKNKKLLKAKVIKLTGQIVSLGGPKTIKKASRPRGGKQREDETNFKALVATLFGERPAHAAEGAWTAAASDIMRRQPDYLTKFHADRQLVEKVLGNGRFLVTPCTFLCPWESPCCPKGVCRLNRFGGISQMYKHWTAKHGDNPAAQQLIARFKVALKNKRLSVEQLNARAPLEHEVEGGEQLRSPDAVTSEAFFFDEFEMHSEGHRAWLAAAGTI
jgi:hypothetical protein|tara:strand:- start:187 stop:972 length:786 start_codon:yes stop_codon:yes gene_type:complete